MADEILRDLQTEYEQRRQMNAAEEMRRRDEAEQRCPEIGMLLAQRQNLIFDSMRGILAGQGSFDDLPQKMEVLNRRIGQLLTEHGYTADWLDPVYRCPRCKDTGYTGEPIRDMCDCMRSEYYKRLYQKVGLTDAAEQCFENFNLKLFSDAPLPGKSYSQRQMMTSARDKCMDWAEQYPQVKESCLLLSGKSGLGKTFLLRCMAKRLIDRGVNVLLMSAYRFLDVARRAYFGGPADELESLMSCDVLMLDDLGSEPLMENITIVQLFNLINERQLAGKATLISTNLNEKELRERYTERVASRLLDKRASLLIPFAGDDVRRS